MQNVSPRREDNDHLLSTSEVSDSEVTLASELVQSDAESYITGSLYSEHHLSHSDQSGYFTYDSQSVSDFAPDTVCDFSDEEADNYTWDHSPLNSPVGHDDFSPSSNSSEAVGGNSFNFDDENSREDYLSSPEPLTPVFSDHFSEESNLSSYSVGESVGQTGGSPVWLHGSYNNLNNFAPRTPDSDIVSEPSHTISTDFENVLNDIRNNFNRLENNTGFECDQYSQFGNTEGSSSSQDQHSSARDWHSSAEDSDVYEGEYEIMDSDSDVQILATQDLDVVPDSDVESISSDSENGSVEQFPLSGVQPLEGSPTPSRREDTTHDHDYNTQALYQPHSTVQRALDHGAVYDPLAVSVSDIPGASARTQHTYSRRDAVRPTSRLMLGRHNQETRRATSPYYRPCTSQGSATAATPSQPTGGATGLSQGEAAIFPPIREATTSQSIGGATVSQSLGGATTSQSIGGATTSQSPRRATTSQSLGGATTSQSPGRATASQSLGGATTSQSPGQTQRQLQKKFSPQHPPGGATITQPGGGATVDDDDNEDGQCCPICFDNWTNSGEHRLVSLKCGHLFGQSCIEKWLKGPGGNKCPQCNVKAKIKDVRVIYAKLLKVMDTSEKDAALSQLEKERDNRRQVELQAAEARMLLQMARDECRRLTSEMTRHKQQLQQYVGGASSSVPVTSSQPSLVQPPGARYTLDKTLKISEAGDCRVMAYCPNMATLCVSQPSSSPLFPGFGVKKVSVLDFRTCQYVGVHAKVIRDICDSPEDNLLLSASMDKTLKITSLSSNTVVQTYTLPMPVWSCTWNRDDPHYVYAGMQNGTVHVYDTRNTGVNVLALNTEGSRSPVVAMQYMRHNPRASFSAPGLVVGQLDRTSLYEIRPDQHKLHMLPLEANLTSLSLDVGSRHLLATYRPTKRDPSVRHMLYELTADTTDQVTGMNCTCTSIHTVHGGSTMKLLARSRLIPHPTGEGGLLVAGDEASQSLHIWDAGSGQQRQKIPIHTSVIDVCHIRHTDSHHLVALTDKQISVLKWSRCHH